MNDRAKLLSALLLILSIGCAALTVHYRQSRNAYMHRLSEVERALESVKNVYADATGTQSDSAARGKSKESAGIYELLDLLASKDQLIADLQENPGINVDADYPSVRHSSSAEAEVAFEPEQEEITFGDISRFEQFLKSIDISNMGELEYSRHVSLVEQVSALQELLVQGPEADDAVLEELIHEVRTRQAMVAGHLAMERNIVLYLTARQMGYDDAMSRWFVEYMTYVFSMTSKSALDSSVTGSGDVKLAPPPSTAPGGNAP